MRNLPVMLIKDRLGKRVGGALPRQDPKEHWGRMFVESLTLVLQVLAVIALLMSVILITNTIITLITRDPRSLISRRQHRRDPVT
jgi:hypothetical protein